MSSKKTNSADLPNHCYKAWPQVSGFLFRVMRVTLVLALRARASRACSCIALAPRANPPVLQATLVLAFFPRVLLQFYFIFDQFDATFDKNNHENGAKLVKMFLWMVIFLKMIWASPNSERNIHSRPQSLLPKMGEGFGTYTHDIVTTTQWTTTQWTTTQWTTTRWTTTQWTTTQWTTTQWTTTQWTTTQWTTKQWTTTQWTTTQWTTTQWTATRVQWTTT